MLGSLVSVLAGAAPASAVVGQYTPLPRTSLAYTDSLAPKQSFENPTGDMPLGSWAGSNGATHVSRVYVSFDLSSLARVDLQNATLDFTEARPTRCQARSVEVWRTDTPDDPITWRDAPKDKALLGTASLPSGVCYAAFLTIDLTTAVRDAVADHRHTLSIALQLPAADEQNVAMGRWLSSSAGVRLGVRYNTPPTKATDLFNDDQPCTTSKPYRYVAETTPLLEAIPHDVDPGEQPVVDFAVWPSGNPAQRTEFSSSSGVSGHETGARVPDGVLANGGVYAWQARSDDGTDVSAWTRPCYFGVDSIRPNAPTVTSNYPQDQQTQGGVPPVFTFDANGSNDVIGYQYSWTSPLSVFGVPIGPNGVPQWTDPFTQAGWVRADHPGGSVSISIPPPPSQVATLTMRSITRSYNISDSVTYRIFTSNTMPTVTVNPTTPQYGAPVTLNFAPNPALSGVDSYTYEFDGSFPGPSHTVAAGPDGTASVTVVPPFFGNISLTVTSHSKNGWVSSPNYLRVDVDTTPTITSDVYLEDLTGTGVSYGGVGVTGNFAFASKVSNATSVTYSFDWSGETTIPLDANGTARVQWTPDASGQHTVYAYVTGADGTVFETYYYYFNVN
ncbi:MAG TPA: DNRLRE domain-containing protein [Actinocrinis sp.]|nr:DNRLRE domain-containing protein [Actinocrinis sp.]